MRVTIGQTFPLLFFYTQESDLKGCKPKDGGRAPTIQCTWTTSAALADWMGGHKASSLTSLALLSFHRGPPRAKALLTIATRLPESFPQGSEPDDVHVCHLVSNTLHRNFLRLSF